MSDSSAVKQQRAPRDGKRGDNKKGGGGRAGKKRRRKPKKPKKGNNVRVAKAAHVAQEVGSEDRPQFARERPHFSLNPGQLEDQVLNDKAALSLDKALEAERNLTLAKKNFDTHLALVNEQDNSLWIKPDEDDGKEPEFSLSPLASLKGPEELMPELDTAVFDAQVVQKEAWTTFDKQSVCIITLVWEKENHLTTALDDAIRAAKSRDYSAHLHRLRGSQRKCPDSYACRRRLDGCPHTHPIRCRYGINCPDGMHCHFAHPPRTNDTLETPPENYILANSEVAPSFQDAIHVLPILCKTAAAQAVCSQQAFTSKLKIGSANRHDVGHAVRDMTIRRGLQFCMQRGTKKILCPNDFARIPTVYAPLERVCRLADDDKMHFFSSDVPHTAEDVARMHKMQGCYSKSELVHNFRPQAVFYNDEYYATAPEKLALTLASLKDAADEQHPMAIIVTNRFVGPFGVSAFQAWERTSNGDLRVYVDDAQEPWTHPDTNAIYFRENAIRTDQGFLVPTIMPDIAGKFILIVYLMVDAPRVSPCKALSGSWNMTISVTISTTYFDEYRRCFGEDTYCPTLLADWLSQTRYNTTTLLAHRKTFAALSSPYGAMTMSNFNYALCSSGVHKMLESEKDVMILRKFCAYKVLSLERDTTNAIFYSQRSQARKANFAIRRACDGNMGPLVHNEDIVRPLGHTLAGVLLLGGVSLCVIKVFWPLLTRISHVMLRPANVWFEARWMERVSKALREEYMPGVSLPGGEEQYLDRFAWFMMSVFVSPIIESFLLRRIKNERLRFLISLALHAMTDGVHRTPAVIPYWLLMSCLRCWIATQPWYIHSMWNLMAFLKSPSRPINTPRAAGLPKLLELGHIGGNVFALEPWSLLTYGVETINSVWTWGSGWFTGGKHILSNVAPTRFRALYNAGAYTDASEVTGHGPMEFSDLLKSAPANPYCAMTRPRDPDYQVIITAGGERITEGCVRPDPTTFRVVPLLVTNGLQLTPTHGPWGMLHAILARQAILTPDATEPELWAEVCSQFCRRIQDRVLSPFVPWSFPKWIAHISDPVKRERFHALYQEVLEGNRKLFKVDHKLPKWLTAMIMKKGNTIFTKLGEMIPNQTVGFTDGVKPRTIQSLTDLCAMMTQPDIQEANVLLKQVLQEPFVLTLGLRTLAFHFTYASGMTGTDLTAWAVRAREMASHGITVIIVLGDDSITMYQKADQMRFVEVDYSHYDASQKTVQLQAEHNVLRALGVREGVLDVLWTVAHAPATYSIRSPKMATKIRVKPSGPARVTGGPNTSLSNSTNNILSLIIARFHNFDESVWPKIGFTAKVNISHSLQKVSFLHGCWFKCEDGTERWSIMPSAIIKLGKTLTPKRSRKNLLQIAYGQGMGIGDVPENYPIISQFRERLITLGSEFKEIHDSYHPKSDFGPNIDRPALLEWMVERYGTTIEEIEQVETDIAQVTSLPYFIGHSLLRRFQNDY